MEYGAIVLICCLLIEVIPTHKVTSARYQTMGCSLAYRNIDDAVKLVLMSACHSKIHSKFVVDQLLATLDRGLLHRSNDC